MDELTIQAKLTFDKDNSEIAVNTYKIYDRTGDSYDRVSAEYMYLENRNGDKIDILLKSQGYNYLNITATPFKVEIGEEYRIRCAFKGLGEVTSPWEVIPAPIKDIGFRTFSDAKKILIKKTKTFIDKHYVFLEISDLTFPLNSDGLKYHADFTFKFPNNESYSAKRWPYCYIDSSDPDNSRIKLVRKVFENAQYKDWIIVETPADHRFEYGCYISLYLESLNANGVDYFEKIQKLNPKSGSLFQRKLGNISSGFVAESGKVVHGKFYIASPSISRIYVSPEEVTVPEPLCPLQHVPDSIDYPQLFCFRCLEYKYASGIKPDFWVD